MEEAGGIFLCAASWFSPSLDPPYMAPEPADSSWLVRLQSSIAVSKAL
uniref:Putative serine/threonine-protein phosphatase 2A regulatory subunit B'' subunit TON2 n=1 Tax=Rhizophora mucronata TaxID=61149 RepID=A0A2P2M2L2_RHIMU